MNESLRGKSAGILAALGSSQFFDAGIFRQIVNVLEEEGQASIAHLVVRATGGKPEAKTAIERHIGRLLKYGLVHPVFDEISERVPETAETILNI